MGRGVRGSGRRESGKLREEGRDGEGPTETWGTPTFGRRPFRGRSRAGPSWILRQPSTTRTPCTPVNDSWPVEPHPAPKDLGYSEHPVGVPRKAVD